MEKTQSVLIAPSLMAANMLCLKDEVQAIEAAGADWLHLDIMDGHFVPNLTFGPDIIRQLRPVCSLPFDVHLMVEPVELCIDLYHKAGADRITIHAEATSHLHRQLTHIKELGCKAGVSINPATAIESIFPVLGIVDQVLIMSVNPGFYGQEFIHPTLEKITKVAAFKKEQELSLHIIVDGGITPKNAPDIIATGADVLIAGNSIFKQANYKNAIESLRI